jgi:hypothetical protein
MASETAQAEAIEVAMPPLRLRDYELLGLLRPTAI